MVVYLKDIDFKDIKTHLHGIPQISGKEKIKLINHTDFSGNRIDQIQQLRLMPKRVFVLGCYNKNYLRWLSFFKMMAYFSKARYKFFIDKSGYIQKLNTFTFIQDLCLTIVSFFYNLTMFWVGRYHINKEMKHHTRIDVKNITCEKMKVAYLRTSSTFNLTAGGSMGHTIGVVQAFKKKVESIKFFGIDRLNFLRGVPSKIVKPDQLSNYFSIFDRLAYTFRFVDALKYDLTNQNFNIIYQRISRDNFSGVILRRSLGIPLVLEFNSFAGWGLQETDIFIEKIFRNISRRIDLLNLEKADFIIVVSEVLKKQLIKHGIYAEKILVNPNCVDSKKFATMNQQKISELKGIHSIGPHKKVVGFCGTFSFWHGVDALGEAIKIFNRMEKKREDVCFFLIGDGQYRRKMEDDFRNSRNVIFTGKVPYNQIEYYLGVCDILVSPHNTKNDEEFIGSPTKLFEYMALGKVIIASDLNQIGQILQPSLSARKIFYEGKNYNGDELGILVPPGEVEDLVKALNFAIENVNELQFLGRNAKNRVLTEYTWDKNVENVLDFIC